MWAAGLWDLLELAPTWSLPRLGPQTDKKDISQLKESREMGMVSMVRQWRQMIQRGSRFWVWKTGNCWRFTDSGSLIMRHRPSDQETSSPPSPLLSSCLLTTHFMTMDTWFRKNCVWHSIWFVCQCLRDIQPSFKEDIIKLTKPSAKRKWIETTRKWK